MYWRYGKDWNEVRANEGRDGTGRPPIKKLKRDNPREGVIIAWKASDGNTYDDASTIIEW